jgi:hypothetical protein
MRVPISVCHRRHHRYSSKRKRFRCYISSQAKLRRILIRVRGIQKLYCYHLNCNGGATGDLSGVALIRAALKYGRSSEVLEKRPEPSQPRSQPFAFTSLSWRRARFLTCCAANVISPFQLVAGTEEVMKGQPDDTNAVSCLPAGL